MSTINISVETNSNSNKKKQSSQGETIKTFCRIRPFNGVNDLFFRSESNEQLLEINSEALSKLNISNQNSKLISSFTFTKIFDEKSTQEEVFESTCKILVDDLFNLKKSGLVFTYGMTNAGKTFTVIGSPSSPGILPQTLNYLFSEKHSNDYYIFCNFVEIYNDDVYDLLSTDPANKGNKFYKKKISVKENSKGVFFLFDVCFEKVDSLETFTSLLNKGIAKKVHAATNLNQNSSRSHTIFKIIISQNDKLPTASSFPSISIVDLAGSERANRTEACGKELQEACKINQSLSVLGKCLEAMRHNSMYTNKKIVPFRESKLTKLFCEYFQGEENIIMITNINPRKEDFEESLRALNYSCLAKDVKPIKSRIISRNPLRRIIKNEKTKDDGIKNENETNNEVLNEENNEDNSYEFYIKSDDDIYLEDNSNCNALTVTDTSSNQSEISKLIAEIKKLREEVANLKSPTISKEKHPVHIEEKVKCLPQPPALDLEEIQKNPTKILDLIPNQQKNQGINLFFINSKFSDFHLGRNGPIAEESDEEESEDSGDEKKKKNKKKKKKKNEENDKKVKKNKEVKKKAYNKKKKKHEENLSIPPQTPPKKEDPPEIISSRIEIKPEQDNISSISTTTSLITEKQKIKNDFLFKTQPRKAMNLFDNLFF